MKQRVFYTELAYVLGIILLPLGVVLMEAADFGVSMVVAPAYLVYLKLSPIAPFFTFGMAEYTLQAVLLIAMVLVLKRFRWSYLLSFVTAVIYGFILDGWMLLGAYLPTGTIWCRLVLYFAGMLTCSVGVALFFHTYISPEVYELFVKELSGKYNVAVHRFKTCYDCVSCAAGVLLSFIFFGLWHFEGVKLGTILCALMNGWLIGRISKFMDAHWRFEDALKLRPIFESNDNVNKAE